MKLSTYAIIVALLHYFTVSPCYSFQGSSFKIMESPLTLRRRDCPAVWLRNVQLCHTLLDQPQYP
jgi:hypothetical protein